MDLANLNKEQLEAVETIYGPCLVLAGAGSGKTRVLTIRIANMINEGIPSREILAITFTNKAAREMKERVDELVPSCASFLGTFHSFGLRVLKEHYKEVGLDKNFTIIDSEDASSIIKKILKDMNLKSSDLTPNMIKNVISYIKSNLLTDTQIAREYAHYPQSIAVKVYYEYDKTLKRNNAVDFDDLLKLPLELFLNNDDILDEYQERYKYILIDEYQDTNEVQYRLVKLLASKYRNLFVVGDANQCIHEDMLIYTLDGVKKIKDVTMDDLILCGGGSGTTSYQPIEYISKDEYNDKILTITTYLGKKIKLTPDHICFYKLPLEENKHYVYLMYKKDMGYRIGQTTSIRSTGTGELQNGLKIRLLQEHGDKIWVLRVCDNTSQATYYEELFAASYGIPKACFHDNGRRLSMSQDYLDKLFSKIDTETRAKILMYDHNLDENYPFYQSQATVSGKTNRKYVNISYLAGEYGQTRGYSAHRIAFNTTDEDLERKLQQAGFNIRKGKTKDFRIETSKVSTKEVEDLANRILCNVDGAEIKYKISLDNNKFYNFINAGSLKVGMIIPVFDNGRIIEDKITSVDEEILKCNVYDLSIPTTRNFIAGDICVHNCIYGFRYSNYKNILNFESDYPEAKSITLNQNYRSTTTILDAANSVIKNNTERKEVNLFSELGKGEKIKYIKALDEKDEAKRVLDEIKKLLDSGYTYNDIAILYRTNAQSRVLEEEVLKRNYPYKVVGSYYFYKRKEIKDLISYLKLISNTRDDVALKRVINEPKRGIGDKSIMDLELKALEENTSMFDALSKPKELGFKYVIESIIERLPDLNLTELIDLVLDKTGMKASLEAEHSLEADIRLENLMEFRSITENYQKDVGTVNLEDFLEEISLVADSEEHKDYEEALTLMTMHSAKGLEFRVVFLVGMEEGVIPHSLSLDSSTDIEEERRLCYVGITRAKEKLYITNARRRMLYGNVSMNKPSRFVTEIDKNLLDIEEIKEKTNLFDSRKFHTNTPPSTNNSKDFSSGDVVLHPVFGRGVIVDIDEKYFTVAFNKRYGIKKILRDYQGLKKQ